MATKSEGRKYDLIVFGVTGYTGKFVAEEIYNIQTSGRQTLKWAVAGRSEEKVKRALQDLGIEGVDVIIADVNDEESIETMCSQTRVILDVVGPYAVFGEVVVKNCISQKCDYVDVTGETYFVELMLTRYGEQAKEAGVYIVNYCGFDSIPNDFGVLVLQRAFNGELAYVESYVQTKAEAANTGTWESALRGMRTFKEIDKIRKSRNEPPPKLPDVRMPKRRSLFYSDLVHSWCIPFMGSDRACMIRSAQYRNEKYNTSMFRTKVYYAVGSLLRFIGMALILCIVAPLNSTNWGFKLLLKYPGFFSAGFFRKGGPTKAELAKGSFTITLEGVGYSVDNTDKKKPDTSLRVKVRGAELGYVATSMMMVQSALCLLDERANLPEEGGIYTPAAAFGDTNIVQKMEATGKLKFTIEQP